MTTYCLKLWCEAQIVSWSRSELPESYLCQSLTDPYPRLHSPYIESKANNVRFYLYYSFFIFYYCNSVIVICDTYFVSWFLSRFCLWLVIWKAKSLIGSASLNTWQEQNEMGPINLHKAPKWPASQGHPPLDSVSFRNWRPINVPAHF